MELDRHGARPPDVIIATFSVGGFIFFGGMGGGHRMEKEIISGEENMLEFHWCQVVRGII